MKKNSVSLLVIGLMAVSSMTALAAKFDFKDPKGVNTATFSLDAPLEAIQGSANGVAGEIQFDPENPGKTSGRITVEAASLHVPNPTMKQHLHAKDWMDVTSHPTLSFEIESLSNVKTSGDVTTADVTGKMTMKGVTKQITIPIKMTYLKDKLAARTNGMMKGDLLVVRSTFTVRRSDFGINAKAPTDKVADEIQLALSLAGSSPRS